MGHKTIILAVSACLLVGTFSLPVENEKPANQADIQPSKDSIPAVAQDLAPIPASPPSSVQAVQVPELVPVVAESTKVPELASSDIGLSNSPLNPSALVSDEQAPPIPESGPVPAALRSPDEVVVQSGEEGDQESSDLDTANTFWGYGRGWGGWGGWGGGYYRRPYYGWGGYGGWRRGWGGGYGRGYGGWGWKYWG